MCQCYLRLKDLFRPIFLLICLFDFLDVLQKQVPFVLF